MKRLRLVLTVLLIVAVLVVIVAPAFGAEVDPSQDKWNLLYWLKRLLSYAVGGCWSD